MLVRPGADDLRIIGAALGRLLTGVGLLMLLPAAVALLRGEWNALSALVVGAATGVVVGRMATTLRPARRGGTTWTHGMVTVGLGWLLGSLLGALPLYLSGHLGSYLDATFEAMSGLTTTGLSLTQDLDHLASSVNLWRHLLQFAGGQAFVIVVLALFTVGGTQASALSVGGTQHVRLLPNVSSAVRSVLQLAAGFAAAATAVLTVLGIAAGLAPLRALLHAVALYLSAYDTGGFSLQSTSVGYYHSPAVEAVVVVLMLAGATAHALHLHLQRRDVAELTRNIESRTLLASLVALTTVVLVGLGRSGAFTDTWPMFRRGFFTLVSAHTATGLTITEPRLIATDWGLIVPAALVAAMAIGGMAASTSGGIKALRIGVTAKGVAGEVRRVLLPESALTVTTFHQERRQILRDEQVRAAATVLLLFLVTYLAGGIVTLFYLDVDFTTAMFESTAATANAGLSLGVTSPDLATPVKLTLLLQMWLGRLEFLAVFAVAGYLVALLRGRT